MGKKLIPFYITIASGAPLPTKLHNFNVE